METEKERKKEKDATKRKEEWCSNMLCNTLRVVVEDELLAFSSVQNRVLISICKCLKVSFNQIISVVLRRIIGGVYRRIEPKEVEIAFDSVLPSADRKWIVNSSSSSYFIYLFIVFTMKTGRWILVSDKLLIFYGNKDWSYEVIR